MTWGWHNCDIFMKAQPESLATGATHNMSRDYLLLLPSCHPTLLLESVQLYPPLAPTFLTQIENNVLSIFFLSKSERERERTQLDALINFRIKELGTFLQKAWITKSIYMWEKHDNWIECILESKYTWEVKEECVCKMYD